MGKTIKTTIDGVPVELEILNVGTTSSEVLEHLSEHLSKEVTIQDGNGGAKAKPIVTSDNNIRVLSVGSQDKPATPADVQKVSNAVSKTDTVALIAELANQIQIEGKNWYTSKVIWINIGAIVVAISGYFGFDLKEHGINIETLISIIPVILAVLNIYFRAKSNEPIKPINKVLKPNQ